MVATLDLQEQEAVFLGGEHDTDGREVHNELDTIFANPSNCFKHLCKDTTCIGVCVFVEDLLIVQ